MPTLELFLCRRGLPSSTWERVQKRYVFANLRSRNGPACRPDVRCITEIRAVVLDRLDLQSLGPGLRLV